MKLSSSMLALLLACLIALTLAVPFVEAAKEEPAKTPGPAVGEEKNPLVAEAEGI